MIGCRLSSVMSSRTSAVAMPPLGFWSKLVCALHWCNPLVWTVARQLRLAQEQACDDLVLLGGVDPGCYAQELVASVRRLHPRFAEWDASLAMAQPSTLDSRVRAI